MDVPIKDALTTTDASVLATTEANLSSSTTATAISTKGVIEYVGLALSILDILIILFVILCTMYVGRTNNLLINFLELVHIKKFIKFFSRRRWRLNQVRLGLMVSLLIMCILWLAVRIDDHLRGSTYSYKGVIFANVIFFFFAKRSDAKERE